MTPTLRSLAPFAAAISLSLAATAQDTPVRLVPQDPIVHLAVHDAPALLEWLTQSALGRLIAEPDVADAIELGSANFSALVQRWTATIERLDELAPERVETTAHVQHAILSLDWRDLRSGELFATRGAGAGDGFVQTTMLVESTAQAETRLAERFAALLAKIGAVVHEPEQSGGEVEGGESRSTAGAPSSWSASGMWLARTPGWFAGGDGQCKKAGRFEAAPRPRPGCEFAVGIEAYLEVLGLRNPGVRDALRALGLDACGTLRWRLRPDGELVRESIGFDLHGRPGGVLGALLDGVAPPVDQPLPEDALLQLRLGFDVPALLAAVDELLAAAREPTLTDMQVAEDLRLAWTGGVAFAVARPPLGGVVPRLYASFGIADADAFGRLVARLQELPGLQPKAVTYEGQPSVQLRLDGAPPALQPSFCLQDGVVHWAESGLSLRALLKAQANGAPGQLDVGDAPRPGGDGGIVPGFDLRFDGAAIVQALHELWLPLGSAMVTAGETSKPLVPMTDMPEPESMVPHLGKGRGVLRRATDHVTLATSGAAGGPLLHVLLAAYGPFLSAMMTRGWHWDIESATAELARQQLERVHAAITAFEQANGRTPADLGELLASGLDPKLLLLPGDDAAQPVARDGQVVAHTSYAYHAGGKKMEPSSQEITARMELLQPIGWRKLVLDSEGTVHESFEGVFLRNVFQQVEIEVEEPPPPPPPDEPEPK